MLQLHSDCFPVVRCLNQWEKRGSSSVHCPVELGILSSQLPASWDSVLCSIHMQSVFVILADTGWPCESFGCPEVDLFTLAWNYHLPSLVTLFPDCKALNWIGRGGGSISPFIPVQLMLRGNVQSGVVFEEDDPSGSLMGSPVLVSGASVPGV